MCLDRLEKFRPCKAGYVVMVKRPKTYRSRFHWGAGANYKPKQWYKSKSTEKAPPGYTLGFHVWHSKRDARLWWGFDGLYNVIVRVEVRGVICVGTQEVNEWSFPSRQGRVTVARERKIIGEVAA